MPGRIATLLDDVGFKRLITYQALESGKNQSDETVWRLKVVLWIFDSHRTFNVDA